MVPPWNPAIAALASEPPRVKPLPRPGHLCRTNLNPLAIPFTARAAGGLLCCAISRHPRHYLVELLWVLIQHRYNYYIHLEFPMGMDTSKETKTKEFDSVWSAQNLSEYTSVITNVCNSPAVDFNYTTVVINFMVDSFRQNMSGDIHLNLFFKHIVFIKEQLHWFVYFYMQDNYFKMALYPR